MKIFDMFYKLDITEKIDGRTVRGVKYGCTNQHAEDRARRVEKSARDSGHDITVKASKYYFNPDRSKDIGEIEHKIHSNSKLRHYDDGGRPFNGSTEIYSRREARKIEKFLSKNDINLKKCGK